MITSKQRAYLRSIASNTDAIIQIGKGGATPEVVESINEAIESREIVKITVLNNCMEDIKDIAGVVSERTRSELVQIIGKKIVLYRRNDKKPIIELPKK